MTKSIILIAGLLAAQAAFADAGACYAVASADGRAYCRAKAHHDPSICGEIINADLRAECRAETH